MTDLLRQIAELLCDSFLRLQTNRGGKWSFHRGAEMVIVTVETIPQSREYESAVAMNGWKIPEEAVNVS